MSFLLPAALALALLIAAPLLAHAFFRGPLRPLWFPAAHFVPGAVSTTQKTSRLEDRLLLSLRILLLLGLALLAASPFVRCSRLALARTDGASVALALVVDDSGSMRVRDDSGPRFEQARRAALELLESAQPGDAFSLIAAGAPARLLVPLTTDSGSVRRALEELTVSDRPTELSTALRLARATLTNSSHSQQSILALSDFAEAHEWSAEELHLVSAPLTQLRQTFENCTLSGGQQQGSSIQVELACTAHSSLKNRRLEIYTATPAQLSPSPQGAPLTSIPATEGQLRLTLPEGHPPGPFVAKLSPAPDSDALAEDDLLEILRVDERPRIGIRADAETAGTQTSGQTVIELGLTALQKDVHVEVLTLLPDTEQAITRYSALILDDPPGLTPETQETLEAWIKNGGVALLLLGPHSQRAPLSAGFWPFTRTSPHYVPQDSPGVAPGTGRTLGEAWDSWTDIQASARASLDLPPEARPLLTWTDGAPFLSEHTLGQGLALVLSLPASVDESDLALRPAFLALLQKIIQESESRRGRLATEVGQAWKLPAPARVQGPAGEIPLRQEEEGSSWLEPALAGRYEIHLPGGTQTRWATRPVSESLTQPPAELPGVSGPQTALASAAPVPLTRPLALFVLVLSALELFFRFRKRQKAAVEASGSPLGPSSTIPSA